MLYFLIGMGIGALVALVIYIGTMTIKAVAERIKKKRAKRLYLERAKELLAEVVNQKNKQQEEEEAISIGEISKLFGTEGCLEYTKNAEGKVNPDDINILQADTMEDNLKALFDQHNGKLPLTA